MSVPRLFVWSGGVINLNKLIEARIDTVRRTEPAAMAFVDANAPRQEIRRAVISLDDGSQREIEGDAAVEDFLEACFVFTDPTAKYRSRTCPQKISFDCPKCQTRFDGVTVPVTVQTSGPAEVSTETASSREGAD